MLVAAIEERFEHSLTNSLQSETYGMPRLTTLAWLTHDAGVDIVWLRTALRILVDTGALRIIRRVSTGEEEVDSLTIADHARFQIAMAQPT